MNTHITKNDKEIIFGRARRAEKAAILHGGYQDVWNEYRVLLSMLGLEEEYERKVIREIASDTYKKFGAEKMHEYLQGLVDIDYISDAQATLIGEDIMIYGR